ncbi:MAG: endolytic transglycosylase MltG [Acidobacteriaceae bacterium]
MLKFLLVVVILAALAVGFFMYVPYGPKTETFVEIAPGTGTLGIARELQKDGVVRSALAFDALVIWRSVRGRRAGSLKAGEYRFDHSVKMAEVYDRIRRGDVYTVSLVIPEGFNIFDIANAVAEAGLDSRADFLAAEQKDTELITEWVPQGSANSLEGYLFPDTYKFSRHAGALLILATMVKQFRLETTRLGITPGQLARVVTMASLVEKEVHLDNERPEVASVFENRMAAGMPLQTDPAVIYASMLRGTWTGVIHQSELKSDSAYNTYTHAGLPPGPICNPGVASLKAALHPASTDYLYFVAEANGQTKFASTLEEHNANVTAYRASVKP